LSVADLSVIRGQLWHSGAPSGDGAGVHSTNYKRCSSKKRWNRISAFAFQELETVAFREARSV